MTAAVMLCARNMSLQRGIFRYSSVPTLLEDLPNFF